MDQKKILFVCLGNICRSPAAEGIMKKKIQELGLDSYFYIDSAGISGFHQGELPDERMRSHASKRGYELNSKSRPVKIQDFEDFDMLIGMDDANIEGLHEKAPNLHSIEKICRLTSYCTNHPDDHVPDPYYGGSAGFEHVLDLLEEGCDGLIKALMAR